VIDLYSVSMKYFVWINNNFNGRNVCLNSADESVTLRGIGIELRPSSLQAGVRFLFVQTLFYYYYYSFKQQIGFNPVAVVQ
jgi:hypothetical protein